MPWKASSVMEERLRFVARLLDGEAMTDVCRDFGVSRKTGYKIFDRYKEHGLEALSDRSRRPVWYANQLPPPIEGLIVRLKGEKPHWGARKIRELLIRRLSAGVSVPALDDQGKPILGEGDGQPVMRAKYSGLHALRHWYCSWSLARPQDGGLGLPLKTVQVRMGHSTLAMTADLYGHLLPATDDAEVLAVGEAALMRA